MSRRGGGIRPEPFRICTLWLLCLIAGSSVSGRTIAIKAGHLVDPAEGIAKAGQIILIDGAKISAVGPKLDWC